MSNEILKTKDKTNFKLVANEGSRFFLEDNILLAIEKSDSGIKQGKTVLLNKDEFMKILFGDEK